MRTKSEQYKTYFNEDYLMGPNSLRLLEELLTAYPVEGKCRILDLGCGKGLTSLLIAQETGATVYANDLWIKAEENAARFKSWQMADQLIPSCEDANRLSFGKNFFDGIISIDSYHYFACKPGFFENKILPFVKSGGRVMIVVPGIKNEFESKAKEVLSPWLGEDYTMFHSPKWWQELIGRSDEIEELKIWELAQFNAAWEDWLATPNVHAKADKKFFETVIKKYTNFVGIVVKKK